MSFAYRHRGGGGPAPVTDVAEHTFPAPLPPPGTTLDIIQPETMDISGGARQQQSPPTNFGVANPSSVRDAEPSGPRRYPTRPRHSPDRYGAFVSY